MDEKLTFLDFETTGFRKNRAVSLGIVHYKNKIRVSEKYYLINPMEQIEPMAQRIHGISFEDVMDEPTFLDLWDEISKYIEGCTIIAHNAQYDIRVLMGELRRYHIECKNFDVICTCENARKMHLPVPNNKLDTLCRYFHLNSGNHHNALDDTIACENLYFCLRKIGGNLLKRA
ncbi:MAG: 3'-5' exoribonuclease [Bacillota bacterium]|nr:3'-5' exoribonuclease [Bacillota bacterium]